MFPDRPLGFLIFTLDGSSRQIWGPRPCYRAERLNTRVGPIDWSRFPRK
jgi:hypothetical protein